jgi:hypothetical protein
MEISEVKRHLSERIERAKRAAVDRRTKVDEASRELSFLEQLPSPCSGRLPTFQVQGYSFDVFTPGGSVRLMSETNADDFIEITLDTTGEDPIVMGRSRRGRGRRVLESERPVAEGLVRNLTEQQVLGFLLKELEPFVEK